MEKITYNNISLDCFMQQTSEIDNRECHTGVISMTNNGKFRFEENAIRPHSWERNPHIFEGRYINMVRRKDGSLKFNFKNVKIDAPDFKAEDYAFHVYSELNNAFKNID